MLRLDLQFYAFFVTILCGAVLGLLFDLLRVMRRHYRPSMVTSSAADLLFWVVATGALAAGMFLANWAELRLYVAVGLGIGVGLYLWLASPIVQFILRQVIRLVEWLIATLIMLFMRLVWGPIKWLALLVWSALQILAGWAMAIVTCIWRLLGRAGRLLLRPFRGPYRCAKLQYLLLKRRLRRRFRR